MKATHIHQEKFKIYYISGQNDRWISIISSFFISMMATILELMFICDES